MGLGSTNVMVKVQEDRVEEIMRSPKMDDLDLVEKYFSQKDYQDQREKKKSHFSGFDFDVDQQAHPPERVGHGQHNLRKLRDSSLLFLNPPPKKINKDFITKVINLLTSYIHELSYIPHDI